MLVSLLSQGIRQYFRKITQQTRYLPQSMSWTELSAYQGLEDRPYVFLGKYDFEFGPTQDAS